MQVRDVMTHGVIGVPESASVAEAIETMLRSRVSALFVFDAKHALIGILSEGDLLRRSELGSEHKRPRWLEFLLGSGRLAESYAHEHGRKVGEVMTPRRRDDRRERRAQRGGGPDDPPPHQAAAGAAGRQCRRRHLALRPAQGTSRRNAAREAARIPTPRSRPPSRRSSTSSTGRRARACSVEVANGVVTFSGAITDERLRDGLKVIAENTPGCVAVHDHMAWIEPNSGYFVPSPEDEEKSS